MGHGNSVQPNFAEEKAAKQSINWVAKITIFLAEVKQEMRTVSFLTWRQVRSSTAVVIIVIVALAAYLFVVDQICSRLLDQMLFRRH